MVKYHYDNPMAIECLVNGVRIPTFPFEAPADLNNESTNCGANNYYY